MVEPPPGFAEALDALEEINGVTIIGHSAHDGQPERIEPGEWHINIDFTKDAQGWEAMDMLMQAMLTPPDYAPEQDNVDFMVWSDAGLRFTITGVAGSDPAELARRIKLTLEQWNEGW